MQEGVCEECHRRFSPLVGGVGRLRHCQRRTLPFLSPVDAAIWLCPRCFQAVVSEHSFLWEDLKPFLLFCGNVLASFGSGSLGKYLLDAWLSLPWSLLSVLCRCCSMMEHFVPTWLFFFFAACVYRRCSTFQCETFAPCFGVPLPVCDD